MKEALPVILGVLKNPYVIGTTIVVVLYMNFCSFVANYRKRPPRPKKAKNAPAPAAPKSDEKKDGDDKSDADAKSDA